MVLKLSEDGKEFHPEMLRRTMSWASVFALVWKG
jgi:hypothetical protein